MRDFFINSFISYFVLSQEVWEGTEEDFADWINAWEHHLSLHEKELWNAWQENHREYKKDIRDAYFRLFPEIVKNSKYWKK